MLCCSLWRLLRIPSRRIDVGIRLTALAPTLTTRTSRYQRLFSSQGARLLRLYAFFSHGNPPHTHIPISFPVQVLTGAPAATSAACCSACAVYNAKLGNNTCGIGVWHNLSPPLCVLKFSANMPVKGHLVIGFIPPPQPLVFRYAHDPLRILHPHLGLFVHWCVARDCLTPTPRHHTAPCLL